jgi:hypothetical protein
VYKIVCSYVGKKEQWVVWPLPQLVHPDLVEVVLKALSETFTDREFDKIAVSVRVKGAGN